MTVIPPPPPPLSDYYLDIHFRGICTHFHSNVLPGIPHRVVLPDATAFRPGLLTGPMVTRSTHPLDWLRYCLMPHIPRVWIAESSILLESLESLLTLTIDGIMFAGFLYTNARLEVYNAIEQPLTYPPDPTYPSTTFLSVPALRDYVPHFAYSGDVVLGGRASAYVDLYGGEITTFAPASETGALRVRARVRTDGPPQLKVTPLAMTDQPVSAKIVTLADKDVTNPCIVVGNFGISCIDGPYDFLLHYLTSMSGIPRAVIKDIPGFVLGELNVADTLKAIEEVLLQKNFQVPPITDIELQASCSDSRYP